MFTSIAAIHPDMSLPLKGAALFGFHQAVANWQFVARLEAGRADNPSELLFSDHIKRELDMYNTCLSLEPESLQSAQNRYSGKGRMAVRRIADGQKPQAYEPGNEDEEFVRRGAERLAAIFAQAQIINQNLLDDYIKASRTQLETQTDVHPGMARAADKFVENAQLLPRLPVRGVMSVFTEIEIEAQAVQAMRYFQASAPTKEPRRQTEGFWTHILDVATQMHISANGAFTYKPQHFADLMPLKRASLQIVPR